MIKLFHYWSRPNYNWGREREAEDDVGFRPYCSQNLTLHCGHF